MNVNRVPLSSWKYVITISKWCSRCVWLFGMAHGQHRSAGTQVSLSLWVLLLGSGKQLVAFSYCWYKGKSVGAAMGTGKRFPVNGLLPQMPCHRGTRVLSALEQGLK